MGWRNQSGGEFSHPPASTSPQSHTTEAMRRTPEGRTAQRGAASGWTVQSPPSKHIASIPHHNCLVGSIINYHTTTVWLEPRAVESEAKASKESEAKASKDKISPHHDCLVGSIPHHDCLLEARRCSRRRSQGEHRATVGRFVPHWQDRYLKHAVWLAQSHTTTVFWRLLVRRLLQYRHQCMRPRPGRTGT